MQNNSKHLELLDNTNKTFEEEFYKYAKPFEYEKGSSPFYPDDLLKYFYVVMDGRVKTYQINFQTNKEQTLFIYKRGDMFDVISLLDGKPHEVIYEVIEDANILRLPIERVRYWLENDLTFNKKFFPYLAAHMRYTEELATELALHDTKERFLNLLVQNLNPNNRFRYQLLQNLSNSEIAKLLGTVRHVIERSIKQLKADDIIETGRRNIKVKNLQKLLDKTSQMLLK
ncbi:Crp/Fnr family transcriptional regulator [Sulfurimonas autotrophica]|uniref:Putative transcriptional regulator, Crp/Fnr family n=1 Tax=Sulfurimonas autotrophica (strain ATCC BAA-671 / DSM 16294 / JCM 11897 / OK10) TaxID=563040 RepID=E0UTR3_SULAO|nr:Crp/Fnr family transcriptional regulator [Sulfurimonas autotrophica]ADN08294.1 putative transcriptional regulator, Crp/Fnr family [Sulfurimonas autotrophica DSM 16294]